MCSYMPWAGTSLGMGPAVCLLHRYEKKPELLAQRGSLDFKSKSVEVLTLILGQNS